jgi:hypothetical protein
MRCLSNSAVIAMVCTLAQATETSWRDLDGHNRLPKLVTGVNFTDGIEDVSQQPPAARPRPSPRFGNSSSALRQQQRDREYPPDRYSTATAHCAAPPVETPVVVITKQMVPVVNPHPPSPTGWVLALAAISPLSRFIWQRRPRRRSGGDRPGRARAAWRSGWGRRHRDPPFGRHSCVDGGSRLF